MTTVLKLCPQRRLLLRNSSPLLLHCGVQPSTIHQVASVHTTPSVLTIARLSQYIPRAYQFRFFSSDHEQPPFFTQSDPRLDDREVIIPDPPTTCCMSGCAHCVWIEYAKELAAIYKDGGEAAEKVMKAIEDPSLKIFLSLELKEALKDSN